MDIEHDPRTGEILAAPHGEEQPVSARALEMQRAIRADNAARTKANTVGGSSLNKKLIAALGDLTVLKKNVPKKTGDASRVGSYTSFDKVVSMLVPRLRAAGILVRHTTGRVFNLEKTFWITVTCHLIDTETGESVDCEMPIPIVRPDPHAIGSAVTYGKRYTLLAVTGLATGDDGEDDDAMDAMPPPELVNVTPADALIADCSACKTVAEYDTWRNKGATITALNKLGATDKAEHKRVAIFARDRLQDLRSKDANYTAQKPHHYSDDEGRLPREEEKAMADPRQLDIEDVASRPGAPAPGLDAMKAATYAKAEAVTKAKRGGPKNRIAATNEGGNA